MPSDDNYRSPSPSSPNSNNCRAFDDIRGHKSLLTAQLTTANQRAQDASNDELFHGNPAAHGAENLAPPVIAV